MHVGVSIRLLLETRLLANHRWSIPPMLRVTSLPSGPPADHLSPENHWVVDENSLTVHLHGLS